MTGRSMETRDSLSFYKYLCHRIGSEEDVRLRRVAFVIRDIGRKDTFITSGSKGEGLDLNGSDFDVMFVDRWVKVYESKADVVIEGSVLPFLMYTEDTPPCYTQLYLLTHHQNKTLVRVSVDLLNALVTNHLGYALSSELYKLLHLSNASFPSKIHGPCIADEFDREDVAFCLKCNTWICQAKPWVSRPRATWPSSDLISNIISCGVLLVPIGCKGSIHENLQWRISFSVAEKILIFSFGHTQFLCYALLKILLKEVIEKDEDLKGLLCSYFLKTLMFWILEETDPYLWRPDNLIPCFKACVQRLLYCVRYSILSHYFIPDNNLFLLRFNTCNKETLTTLLKNVYGQGINSFAFTESLQDYQNQCIEITELFISEHNRFLQHFMPTYVNILNAAYGEDGSFSRLLYKFLHHSRTMRSKGLFALQISAAFQVVPEATNHMYSSSNKHRYLIYKNDLSHLMTGLHSDAISGLLMLASFFYAAGNYLSTLTVLTYTMEKYTDDIIYLRVFNKSYIYHIKQHVVKLTNKETIHTILKLLTTRSFELDKKSSIVPEELRQDVASHSTIFHPLPFAHFLSFLCYYHLHDITSCRQSLQHLQQWTLSECSTIVSHPDSINSLIMCGIAHQFLGELQSARDAFRYAVHLDYDNETSAVSRLSSLF